MMTWLQAHAGTLLVAAVVCGVIALVILGMLRDKKKGGTSCHNCSKCALQGTCHREQDEQ